MVFPKLQHRAHYNSPSNRSISIMSISYNTNCIYSHSSFERHSNDDQPKTQPQKMNPDLDLLGTYLYIFLDYQPLHSLTKTLTLSWLGLLACMPHMLSSSSCASILHVLFFLHACLLSTCFFSFQL